MYSNDGKVASRSSQTRLRSWMFGGISMAFFLLAVLFAELQIGGMYVPLFLVVIGGFAMLVPVIHRDTNETITSTNPAEKEEEEEENIFA